MRRRAWPALLLLSALIAVGAADAPADSLQVARADEARASADERRLAAAADRARGEAAKLAIEQRAAAAAVIAAEARIDIAEQQLRLARGTTVALRQRLAERQAPVAALVAGLVEMGRRPPLLAIVNGSAEDFVRMRALLDAGLPVIRARSAGLAAELEAARRAEKAARDAQVRIAAESRDLDHQRMRFAALERRALGEESRFAGEALNVGDVGLASGETVDALRGDADRRRAGTATARILAALDPIPARPIQGEGSASAPPFRYELPAAAPVDAGLGSIDPNGIRSRGLALATARGAEVRAPADGIIAFAGPHRREEGIVIIDHDGGWLSLLVNVSSPLTKGSRVAAGQPLGRALGPIEVELSQRGTYLSPAFIAASSAMLSKRDQSS